MIRWEIRQSNFMGGYDVLASRRLHFPIWLISRLTRKPGCAGKGCTAGCTYVARKDEEERVHFD